MALALVFLATGVGAYPIARERDLGERFSLEAAGALPIIRDPEVVVFVNRMGQGLVDVVDPPQFFDYRFSVVDNRQLNAFAVPGGFIFLHSGLITRAGNDSELASVIGHEIAHSHAHHIVRQQEKSQLASYAAMAGMLLSIIQPALGAVAMGASATAQLKYLRDFEQEADYLGLRYLRKAAYQPHGMADFMKRILEEKRMQPLEIPPYLLSHPLTDERITNLQVATRDDVERAGWRSPSLEMERVQAILQALTETKETTLAKYEADATDTRGWLLLGLVQLHQGDATVAIETFRKAKALGAEAIDGDLGLALLRAGRLDEALLGLRARVESTPDDAVARAYLGEALLVTDSFDEARHELTEALRRLPMLDYVELSLGQAYGKAGDAPRGLYHLARAFEMRGEVDRAISHYERALEKLPKDSPEEQGAKGRLDQLRKVAKDRSIKQRR